MGVGNNEILYLSDILQFETCTDVIQDVFTAFCVFGTLRSCEKVRFLLVLFGQQVKGSITGSETKTMIQRIGTVIRKVGGVELMRRFGDSMNLGKLESDRKYTLSDVENMFSTSLDLNGTPQAAISAECEAPGLIARDPRFDTELRSRFMKYYSLHWEGKRVRTS